MIPASILLEKAKFDEHDAWYRCGYDSEKEPGVREIVSGAKGESFRLMPLLEAAVKIIEVQSSSIDFLLKRDQENPMGHLNNGLINLREAQAKVQEILKEIE